MSPGQRISQEAPGFSLAGILGADHEDIAYPGVPESAEAGWDEENAASEVKEGFCVECEGAQLRSH